ncbi:hypothetical protein C0Z18_03735 [Trinickia dabaoshanensis]|uniref:Uncharacterized protein n=2 Tax=Trinickia dabaoshanensis TaxID=564714 RepID=A0A2N7VZY4_9BURK|nr:hypothetical protein C0Z18_03735 [Trinickia dabaoshanensis]
MGTFAALALMSAFAAGNAAAAAAAADAAASAAAPATPAASNLDDTPTAVAWKLDVVRDGRTIDTFEATTMVGQTFNETHHHPMQHRVGCKDNPAGGIDLARTVSVSPVAADVGGVTLALDTDETIEDDTAPTTPEGCALPPQPRRVNASHPGLLVPMGESADWTLIDKNPTLVYRVHASIAPH